ncbi:MAG: transglutaminase family protein [Planctomycetota bacterium]
MSRITKNEVESLLKLLVDDNRFVSEAAAHRLYEIADDAHEQILRVTEGNNLVLQLRARKILDRRRLDNYQKTFVNFARSSHLDLEDGCKIICLEDFYPTEAESISTQLDDMAAELALTYPKEASHEVQADAICNFVFETKGFRGNRENYYTLDNSFMNRVIESRRGIPLTLGVFLILLGKRLDFTFRPISVPTHFLLHFGNDPEANYLDPFNAGRKLTRQNCVDFLKKVGVVPHPSHLEPVDTRQVLARMLRNLAAIYHQAKSHRHAEIIEQRIQILLDA